MKIIDGGITAPMGYYAMGSHVGIKRKKKDLSLVFSKAPAVAAGVFTQSVVKAAPVLRNKALIEAGGVFHGIVSISGVANACTGDQGIADNAEMARLFAHAVQKDPDTILTGSTGIIGKQMPMDVIALGIPKGAKELDSHRKSAEHAAKGISTTDTFLKEMAVEIEIGGKTVTFGAMAKGSGMIHPNMATVLAYITTDAVIDQKTMQQALSKSVEDTYNMISVDGSMSTNDMVLVLANGLAENPPIVPETPEFDIFFEAIHTINTKLAMDVVRDGEGATKLLEVKVSGAQDKENARILAKSIVTDNLVKTALFGEDANWGRILAAMGGSGGAFLLEKLDIALFSRAGRVMLMEAGQPVDFPDQLGQRILQEQEIFFQVSLGQGTEEAFAWGCDLGHEYIRINGAYKKKGG